MNIYVAASFERKSEVKDLQGKLRELGHTIAADWTLHKSVGHDVADQQLARDYASEDITGVRLADVFILLINDRKSTGAHIEFGAALAAEHTKVILVGPLMSPTLFYFHPKVRHLESVEELLVELSLTDSV